MTYYISGPMSGIEDDNLPAFKSARVRLRKRGHNAVLPDSNSTYYRTSLRIDFELIFAKADALYMLKGWEHSPGARAEHAVAVALRLPIAYEGSV